MSWISDVREELSRLNESKKKLRTFGLSVGIVLIAFASLGLLKKWNPVLGYSILFVGLILCSCGVVFPGILKHVHRIWMGFAFAMGWIVSRIIVIVFFYAAITPFAVIARMVGKKFLSLDYHNDQKTFWIPKDPSKKANYEKLY
jgi:Saxitoxin biosynthesis operon protein SxtJ